MSKHDPRDVRRAAKEATAKEAEREAQTRQDAVDRLRKAMDENPK